MFTMVRILKTTIAIQLCLATLLSTGVNGDILQDNFMLALSSSGNNLYQLSLSDGTAESLIDSSVLGYGSGLGRLVAVAYDPVNKDVYLTGTGSTGSGSSAVIGKYSLISSIFVPLYTDMTGTSTFSGLALDISKRMIYYTDTNNGLIGELSMDGGGRRTVIVDSSSQPYAIICDKQNRWLYFTDTSNTLAGIYRVSIDTGIKEALVSSDVRLPLALAVDFSSQKIYWADSQLNSIEMADIDGTQRSVLITSSGPLGLSIDATFLYFSGLYLGSAVSQVHRRTLDATNFLLPDSNAASAIVIYNSTDAVCIDCPPIPVVVAPPPTTPAPNPPANAPPHFDFLQDNFMLVTSARGKNLYQFSLAYDGAQSLFDNSALPVGNGLSSFVAVAYDPVYRDAYLAGSGSPNVVGKYSTNNDTFSIFYSDSTGTAAIKGLALNNVQRSLYYSDSNNGLIGELPLDGSEQNIIFQDSTSQPYALVYDIQNRWLYFTDISSNLAGIHRISVDTGERTLILAGSDVRQPQALAVDFNNQVVYWADVRLNRIDTANLDGSGRSIFLASTGTVYGLALDTKFLYFTGFYQWHSAVKVNRQTLAVTGYSLPGSSAASGLVIYNSADSTCTDCASVSVTAPSTIKRTKSTSTTRASTVSPSSTNSPVDTVIPQVYTCGNDSNPCTPENAAAGKFYFPNVSPSKYVQCSQWGQCYVQPCAPGTVWKQDLLTCIQ